MNIAPYANQVKIRALRMKQRRLNQLMKGNHVQVVVYTKSNCPNCLSAKALLESKGLGYEERDFENWDNWKELASKYPEARQMPQIFIDGQRVGGLAGLQAALKQLGV